MDQKWVTYECGGEVHIKSFWHMVRKYLHADARYDIFECGSDI